MMRVFLAFAVLLASSILAHADGIDDQYVRIYNLIQEGDSLSSTGKSDAAMERYSEAQKMLQRFQQMYPLWNTKVVAFRLSYLAMKVGENGLARVINQPGSQKSDGGDRASANPTQNPPSQASAASQAELNELKDQLRQLQADKILLEAKLKEALSAMPAATDPREVAKAEERVRSLLKENDLLKANLDLVKSRAAKPAGDPLALQKAQKDLADANRRLSEQTEKANLLTVERNALQAKLKTLEPNAWNSAALDATRRALEEANRQIVAQKESLTKLTAEKAALQTRLNATAADIDAAAALRAENQLLKKQVADLRASNASLASKGVPSKQSSEAQAQIASLRSDRDILRLEKLALEDRLRRANTLIAGSARVDDSARVQQLEKERDDLQKKLDRANQELASNKSAAAATRVQELETQLAALRTRLDVFEARQVPYTPEELALFRKPETTIAANPANDPNVGKKSLRDLPPGSATLVAEADRYFSAKQYDKAEDRYLQILHKDERNVPTLANLAAIQLEMNRLDEAEKHIQQAVALAPNDAYSLSILGYLKFRQQKYDDALDALSKAAKLDPQNAQIQNYLGITLSQKGMRAPAETALRKAIQLQPGYGSAHHNLAVIYATQKPPLIELARWHYVKALNAGHPRNAQLEKLFDGQKTPEEAQVQKTAATSGSGK